MIKRQFYLKVCIQISLFDENFDENKDAKHIDVKVDCIQILPLYLYAVLHRFHFFNRTNSYSNGYTSFKTEPRGVQMSSLRIRRRKTKSCIQSVLGEMVWEWWGRIIHDMIFPECVAMLVALVNDATLQNNQYVVCKIYVIGCNFQQR